MNKTLRFEVFKRDNFRCQYCRKTPPEITLELDHINPQSKGGTDDINNLLTSCFDCNRGKRDIVLETVPNSIVLNLEILKEKELQLKEYNRFIKKIQRRIFKECEEINQIYSRNFPGWELSEKFRSTSLRIFLNKLPKEEVAWAMTLACEYMGKTSGSKARDTAIPYFCGICWKKIRGDFNVKD